MPWKPRDGEIFPSLGWHIADQMEWHLAAPDRTDYEPFILTREQLEFLVRLYELDPVTGHRVKHRAVLQRPRGWGKSPFLAGIGIGEGLFDVCFDGWDAEGQPVGKPWSAVRTPLVLITATSEEQVKNTWTPLLEMLREGSAVDDFDLEPMDTFVAMRSGRIEPRASSARAVKGARAVAAIMDQTEEWVQGNGGIRFAQNLRNNATKIGGMTIESPNAFTPGERSVAEASAKFWDNIKSGKMKQLDAQDVRSLLYDHREAPAETDTSDMQSLVAGLRVAYGDSSNHPDGCVLHTPACPPGWSPIGRIAADFWDTSNDPQTMRADFLNQITHATNSYVSQPEMRAIQADKEITPQEPITLGFDGSEGRKPGMGVADSTVLIGYSVNQKHLFEIGVWEQPIGPKGEGWKPPTLEVEAKVRETFKKYNVVGFYADPSAGWAGQVKTWESDHHRQLKVKLTNDEPIKWRQKEVGRTVEAFINMRSAIVAGEITYDGSAALTKHFLNARRDPRRNGYVVTKPDDDQDGSKVDAVWGAAFAFACGIDALGKGILLKKKSAPRRIY
jgi:hypothetical protein